LRAAFADVARIDPASLTVGDSLEASVIRHFLQQRSWQQLDAVLLDGYDSRGDLSALPCFLSADGFVYYLPSLLLYVLERDLRAGLLIDTLTAALRRYAATINGLSPEMRAAISEALDYFEALHAADELYLKDLSTTRASLAL
jgi:hypothetical protein